MAKHRTRLREARLEAGLTQQEVADVVGLPRANVARWESGTQLPRVDNALKLAAALDSTVESLWPLDHDDQERPDR